MVRRSRPGPTGRRPNGRKTEGSRAGRLAVSVAGGRVSAIVGARLVRPVSPAVARRALVVCTVHGGRQQLGRSTVLPPALDRIGSSPPESSSPGPSRRSELARSGNGMAVRTTGCASASRGTPRDFGRIAEGSQRRSARRRSSRFASFQQERRRLETATAQRICRAGCPMRPCRCGLTRPPAPWLHAARLRFRPHRSGQENAARGRLTASSPIRCGRTAAAVRPRPSFAVPEMARSPLARSPRTLPNLRTGRAIAAASVRWPE